MTHSATKIDQNELAMELLGPKGNNGPAHQLARRLAPGNRELADDAATDAVLWALRKYDPDKHHSFRGLALRNVRTAVFRSLKKLARNRARTIQADSLGDETEIEDRRLPSSSNGELPLEVRDSLDDTEATAVKLFYIYRFTLQETAERMGYADHQSIRGLLTNAAKKLRPDATPQEHDRREHRLRR